MAKRAGSEGTAKPKHVADTVEMISGDDFFSQIRQLTPEDWQSHKVYLYRTWPVIDKRDDSHYLAKLSEPFDEDVILRNWGSGKYNLRLNNGQGETVCSKTVSLHNPAFPPKVSPDEVVQTDPRNERYFKVWPVVPQPMAGPADSAAVQELSRLAAKALDQQRNGTADGSQASLTTMLVNWALEQTSKEREASDPTRIAGLLKELKTLLPPQPADGLAMVDRVLSIAEKLNPQKAQHQDPLDYMDKVLTLADKLRPSQGAAIVGDAGNLASMAAIVHEVGDLLKNPLTIAAQVWAASKGVGNGGGPATPPQPAGAGNSPAGPPVSPATMMPFLQMIALPMVNYVRPIGPPHNVNPTELGTDFASWVYDGFGADPRYEQAIFAARGMGPMGVIAAFRSTPLWTDKGPQNVQPSLAELESKLPAFFEAFLTWEPESEDESEEADPAPPEVLTYSGEAESGGYA